ncbi:bile acid:sodium symporter family protein [Oceanicoccus sp. KOV_DT_Chl]|uniref:bile acid:sodium symporter family protein n=1 Tax=Oceanicoccus sp. KOV_DT_Chl TaxID=1904639 RepID=UPI000C7CC48E|nr:bile acid:sodium symporter family protein [Oceanicoccus sp. KOV_DT_Chl]
MDITKILLAITLCLILFSVGMSLTKADFIRVIRSPKTLFIAFFCQLLVIPFCAVLISKIMQLSAPLSLGLLLIAVSPGGASSNLFTRLAGGDTALSISLTAMHSLCAALTIPLLLFLGQYLLSADDTEVVSIPVSFLIQQLVFITFLPLIIGMSLRHFFPAFIMGIEEKVLLVVSLLFFSLIAFMWYTQWNEIVNAFKQAGIATALLLILTCLSGYLIAKAARFKPRQETTLVIEVGIQNSAVAFFIAVNVFDDIMLSTPTAIYSVIMTLSALLIIPIYRRSNSLD